MTVIMMSLPVRRSAMNPFFKHFRIFGNSRGQAIIELAMIFPLLFIFFYAISEFSTLFVNDQRVTALSREAAGAAFRECGGLPQDDLGECLQDIVDEVSNRAQNLLREFGARGHIIVSVYQQDPDAGGAPAPVEQTELREAGNGGIGTQFTTASFDANFMTENGLVVVGEAYYENEVLTPIQQLLTLLQLPESLYESTLF